MRLTLLMSLSLVAWTAATAGAFNMTAAAEEEEVVVRRQHHHRRSPQSKSSSEWHQENVEKWHQYHSEQSRASRARSGGGKRIIALPSERNQPKPQSKPKAKPKPVAPVKPADVKPKDPVKPVKPVVPLTKAEQDQQAMEKLWGPKLPPKQKINEGANKEGKVVSRHILSVLLSSLLMCGKRPFEQRPCTDPMGCGTMENCVITTTPSGANLGICWDAR